jgi:hypothetical protein
MTSIESFSASQHAWQNFYSLVGTAAATLTGLMFLSVTFGSTIVTKKSATAARAFTDPTFMHFVQVFIICCLMNVPTITPPILGLLLIGLAGLRLVPHVWVYRQLQYAHSINGDLEMSDWLMYVVLPLLNYILLTFSGLGFVFERAAAFNGLAIFAVGHILIGILCAWELLVWMVMLVSKNQPLK